MPIRPDAVSVTTRALRSRAAATCCLPATDTDGLRKRIDAHTRQRIDAHARQVSDVHTRKRIDAQTRKRIDAHARQVSDAHTHCLRLATLFHGAKNYARGFMKSSVSPRDSLAIQDHRTHSEAVAERRTPIEAWATLAAAIKAESQ